MNYKEPIINSTNLTEISSEFDVDQKSPLCNVAVESTWSKESVEDSLKSQFNFTNTFQAKCSKSNCRGDVIEDQGLEKLGGFCRQGLGENLSLQNRISSNKFYGNEQTANAALSDSVESNIESMKTLSLKTDITQNFLPMSTKNAKISKDVPYSVMAGDVNPFTFERSMSAQKFDSCTFLGDATNANPNGKSHSTPESSSGIDSAYLSANPHSQMINRSDNPCESHLGGVSGSYWNTSSNSQVDDSSPHSALPLNNLSPLLTSLLYQQPASANSGQQSNQANVASVVAKRAIIGGHQSLRPMSRSPAWNHGSNSFDSNFMASSSDQTVFGSPAVTAGLPLTKPGWMSQFSSQSGSSYPWSSTASSNFGDTNSGGFNGNGIRFGINTTMGSNGFLKGQSSSNPLSLYSMFPKRPPHRMMAHWQQQQHHQQHMQPTSGSILNKQHTSDFPPSGSSPFGGHENVSSQKVSHGAFGPLGSNPGITSMSGNVESLNSDKLSGLDNFRAGYGFDQHLLDITKSMDSSANPSNLLDDLTPNNMTGLDNYHGNIHSLLNMPQPRSGMLPLSSMQNMGIHGMGNTHSSLSVMTPREEGYSRKVFVGGLPPDIDEEEITTAFRRFGTLIVDWPHKTESKAYFPPKGYCFLLFQDEQSVQDLINACIVDEGKYYWCVSSPTMKDKPVQIRPWSLADSDFVMDGSQTLDPRKTIFVGGVPRPLRAIELALIMDRLYGGVCYAGIDIDPELKYPKGAGRVAFSNQQSYIAAISARFVQLQHNDIDKRVEVKPYVLDNQMCDECQGARCGGKFAPLFCANVTCLQYYCEQCWFQIHSRQGREFHKPLVKEGAERPRPALYRW